MRVSGRGSRPARATFPWPTPGGSVTVDVLVGVAPEVVIEVRADPGAGLLAEVERWNGEKGLWQDPLRWGSSDLMGIEAPGVRKVELRNGRYRLLVWRIARQIRIDRRVPEDEVVRVTLQDKDGAVLFEGEVR